MRQHQNQGGPARSVLGCGAWVGLTALQSVIAVAFATAAYFGANVTADALGLSTTSDGGKAVTVVLFLVFLGALVLGLDRLLKNSPVKWLRFSENPLWTSLPP